MGRWDWVKVREPSRITQTTIGTRIPGPSVVGGRKTLNAEAGRQRAKRPDGSGTSRISVMHPPHSNKNRWNKNIEGYGRDQQPYFVIGAAQRQP